MIITNVSYVIVACTVTTVHSFLFSGRILHKICAFVFSGIWFPGHLKRQFSSEHQVIGSHSKSFQTAMRDAGIWSNLEMCVWVFSNDRKCASSSCYSKRQKPRPPSPSQTQQSLHWLIKINGASQSVFVVVVRCMWCQVANAKWQ